MAELDARDNSRVTVTRVLITVTSRSLSTCFRPPLGRGWSLFISNNHCVLCTYFCFADIQDDIHTTAVDSSVFRGNRERVCERNHVPSRFDRHKAPDDVVKKAQRYAICSGRSFSPHAGVDPGLRGIVVTFQHILRAEGWSGLYDGVVTDTSTTILSKWASLSIHQTLI